MPVATEELAGSPELTFNRAGQASAKRRFLIAWSDIEAFTQEVIGLDFTQSPVLSSFPAQAMPGFPALIADTVNVSPFNMKPDSASPPTYEAGALVEVNYVIPDKEFTDDGIFYTRSASVGAEFLTFPDSSLKWASDNEKLDESSSSGLLLPAIQHSLTYHNVSTVPWSAIRGAVGKINSSGFLDGAAECVLFEGCVIRLDDNRPGMALYEVDYSFSEKPQSWNLFLRPGSGWENVLIDGPNIPPYETASFSGIFPTS